MTTPANLPSPELFLGTVNAYQRTELIKAAVELEVFTAIGAGAQTTADLATRCAASERGLRILCDNLTILGFLSKSEPGNTPPRYELTLASAVFLDQRSPAYLGGALGFMLSPLLADGFKDLASAVRRGGTAMPAQGSLAPDHPMWVEYARSMGPMMALPAHALATLAVGGAARPMKVLDVAAGHGLFGIAVAQQNVLADVVALDWPNVLQVARENAERAGVSKRYRTLGGDALEVPFGDGYDVILLTNFLHHFDTSTLARLLSKVHAALAPGGKAVTLEFVPDDNRVTPALTAQFSLIMLATTPGGDAYTYSELDHLFKNAGFSRNELYPLPPSPQQAIISQR